MADLNQWTHSFWSCCSPFGTCCLALLCPCSLYGRTSSREDNPADVDESGCNGDCFMWSLANVVGFSLCLTAMGRTSIRRKYHIEGNVCEDWCAGCFCPCCVLMQNEKESEARSGLMAPSGYQTPAQGMVYNPAV